MDKYGDQLREICRIIERAGFSACVRGEQTARFVYAEDGSKAVEIYFDGVGFVVELFERPAESSVRDYQRDRPELAAEQAVEWLSGNERAG